jgi:D-glycero-beta-D-manno-heptose 1-phosphate adenylyltransferase
MIVDPSTRLLNLSECVALRAAAGSQGRRVVLTNGCFDILHRGHLEYLRQSAMLGDFLIVAVNSDESVSALKGPSRPLNPAVDRAYALACLRFVDATFIFQGPRLADEILALRPDVYTKAGDYSPETLERTEFSALECVGARIVISPFIQGYSTTLLVDRMNGTSG